MLAGSARQGYVIAWDTSDLYLIGRLSRVGRPFSATSTADIRACCRARRESLRHVAVELVPYGKPVPRAGPPVVDGRVDPAQFDERQELGLGGKPPTGQDVTQSRPRQRPPLAHRLLLECPVCRAVRANSKHLHISSKIVKVSGSSGIDVVGRVVAHGIARFL